MLLIEGETVTLANILSLDVADFRACLAKCAEHGHPEEETCMDCLPLLEKAASLYKADFLAGFTLRDAPEFDDWRYFEGESLRREYGTVLQRLVTRLSRQGDYGPAIRHARRWVALDRFQEQAQQQLMSLYALTGHRHEALRQYQAYVESLDGELGSTPAPETTVLYQQIVNGDPLFTSTPPTKPTMFTPIVIEAGTECNAPLVGRERELETVWNKVNSSWHGQGATIFLTGVSGVGKTRLAHEILRNASQATILTLVGAAYEQEGHLPYYPFIEAIDRYLAECHLPPEQNPITHYKPIGLSDPQQENSALFRATAAFFINLTLDKPILLFVDDLHAADEASLSLFHHLARQTRNTPIILLATYRTDIVVNGTTSFGRLLNALYREGFSETVNLAPLTEVSGAKIINHILTGRAKATLVEAIFEISEGNPFYVQEITRAIQKADYLQQKNGQWSLRPNTQFQIPAGLRDLLRERVQRLGPDNDSLAIAARLNNQSAKARAYEVLALACHSLGEWQQGLDFEQKRSTLVGANLDVTEAFDIHL